MDYIAATSEYGIVVRKAALTEKGVPHSLLTEIMKDIDILGESESLISFGPLFGVESLEEINRRLSSLGLIYVDDFFNLDFLLPEWAALGVCIVT